MLVTKTYYYDPIDIALGIEPEGIIVEDTFEVDDKYSSWGELNPFYGMKHTDETKAILSKKSKESTADRRCWGEKNGMYGSARFGELNPMWGKTQKESTRKKISESNKGKKGWNKGIPCSDSNKKAISEKNSRSYSLINPEGKVIKLKNLIQFCKDNELDINCMRHVVAGRNKQHRGWGLWENH